MSVLSHLLQQVRQHDPQLADGLPKRRGLADFTETFGDEFHRIEAVAEVAGQMRVRDLLRDDVREAIRAATDTEALYLSDAAENYVTAAV